MLLSFEFRKWKVKSENYKPCEIKIGNILQIFEKFKVLHSAQKWLKLFEIFTTFVHH